MAYLSRGTDGFCDYPLIHAMPSIRPFGKMFLSRKKLDSKRLATKIFILQLSKLMSLAVGRTEPGEFRPNPHKKPELAKGSVRPTA